MMVVEPLQKRRPCDFHSKPTEYELDILISPDNTNSVLPLRGEIS
jgi:hypothetical protein